MEKCAERHQVIHCSYLAEQHGKNHIGCCFGTVSRWIDEYALRKPVHTVQQLLQALKAGAATAMRQDPTGPQWCCLLVGFGQHKAKETSYVRAQEFKIVRTYCLDTSPPARNGLSSCVLRNKVFSDVASAGEVTCARSCLHSDMLRFMGF